MARGGRPYVADVVDALIVGLAAGLVIWFAAIHPTTQTHQPSLLSALIADAYPTMDYLLVLGLAQLLFTRTRNAALAWVTASFATVLVTDVVYAWLRSSSSFTTASWVNAGYFGFYILLGAATLSPSMRSLDGSVSNPSSDAQVSGRLTLLRLALLAVALIASPAALVLEGAGGDESSHLVIAAVGAVVSILVLVRLALLFVERDRIDVQRQRAEAALERMAYRDGLTDLPNRASLITAVEDEIVASAGHNCFGLLFVDLDRFKEVNDRYGHADGDRVLREAAGRLAQAVRGGDLVARHGGDEFVVLLRGLPEDPTPTINSAVARIRRAIASPVDLTRSISGEQVAIELGLSIGAAVYPLDGATADELIYTADTRMYENKQHGRAAQPAA